MACSEIVGSAGGVDELDYEILGALAVILELGPVGLIKCQPSEEEEDGVRIASETRKQIPQIPGRRKRSRCLYSTSVSRPAFSAATRFFRTLSWAAVIASVSSRSTSITASWSAC